MSGRERRNRVASRTRTAALLVVREYVTPTSQEEAEIVEVLARLVRGNRQMASNDADTESGDRQV